MPSLINNVLEQLGWSNGMFIPVANEENKILELLLDKRNKELQQLKDDVAYQNSKKEELEYHHRNIKNEHTKNMQLLIVYKEAVDNEDHHDKLVCNEISKTSQDIAKFKKEMNDINERSEYLQANIAKILKKMEELRNTVPEDKESLDKWREVLKRNDDDIVTINNFIKEDNSTINQLEIKRQRLKQEYDKKHINMIQLCGNLTAEEKSAERVSEQVMDALNQRRHIMTTWSEAIKNLHQRDKNIKQMREELETYRQYAVNKQNFAQEKQEFLSTQKANNDELEREIYDIKLKLTERKLELKNLTDNVKAMENELAFSKRGLANMSDELSNCRFKNKKLGKEIKKKEDAIQDLDEQIIKYKKNLDELADGSKTALQRLNQLEDMLNNEEKYLKQIITETGRTKNRLLNVEGILASLKDDEEKFMIEIKGFKTSLIYMEGINSKVEKELLMQEENLYSLNYKIEMAKTRLAKMEGECEESVDYKMLQERIDYLQEVLQEKQSSNNILSAQITKLDGDYRLVMRDIFSKQKQYEKLEERYKELIAETDGISSEDSALRKAARALRADLSGLQLQSSYAENNLKKINNKGDIVAKAHLDLNTAVRERIVEANEVQAIYLAQKRTLQEEHGKLVFTIKSEQIRLEQIKKRYDIYVATLGKDENGDVLSVAYYKIKNAQEKFELQQEGDNLDAQIKKGEKEIAALEATLQVVDATNRKFIHNLDTVKDDDPDMLEYNALCAAYVKTKELKVQLTSQSRQISKQVDNARKEIKELEKRADEIQNIRDDLIDEIKLIKKDLNDQMEKLNRSSDYRKKTSNSARKKIGNMEIWSIHEKDIKTRELCEANRSAEAQLRLLNMPLIIKKASEHGISLPQSFSAPSEIKLVNAPSNASVGSEQESWMQNSSEGAVSERSTSCMEEYTGTSESKIVSDSRTSSQISIKETKSLERNKKQLKSEGNYAPISVVVLGMNDPSTSNDSLKKDTKKKQVKKKP